MPVPVSFEDYLFRLFETHPECDYRYSNDVHSVVNGQSGFEAETQVEWNSTGPASSHLVYPGRQGEEGYLQTMSVAIRRSNPCRPFPMCRFPA